MLVLPNARLMPRVYMPKVTMEEVEKLKADTPFLMKALIPRGARFVDVCPIPSLVDMLGFSGGGGPPSFAYVINPDEKKLVPHLLMTSVPEHAFTCPPVELDVILAELGVVQCMGMLLMCFQWSGHGIAELEQHFVDHGAFIIDMQPYEVPDMLRTVALQKMVQQQAKNKVAEGKA